MNWPLFTEESEDDDEELGQDLLYDVPPDPEPHQLMSTESDSFIFECSDQLPIPLYNVTVHPEEGFVYNYFVVQLYCILFVYALILREFIL